MAYKKRSDDELIVAYAAALRTDEKPDSKCILINDENLSPRELADALERRDMKVVKELLKLIRSCARDLGEDPLVVVRSDGQRPGLRLVQ